MRLRVAKSSSSSSPSPSSLSGHVKPSAPVRTPDPCNGTGFGKQPPALPVPVDRQQKQMTSRSESPASPSDKFADNVSRLAIASPFAVVDRKQEQASQPKVGRGLMEEDEDEVDESSSSDLYASSLQG
eukprot:275052-Hanusia_phi.AAC.1